jgi:hypothetical protein
MAEDCYPRGERCWSRKFSYLPPVSAEINALSCNSNVPYTISCYFKVQVSLYFHKRRCIQRVLGERSIFWEVIVSVVLSKKVYMYMCPIPSDFRDRCISLHSSKIVDKEISRTVSNTGIYCSSEKVGAVYSV